MTGRPLVSVVVPSFQNAPYVEQAVRSVLDQTYEDLEVVVADHGSTDGTWEVLQAIPPDPRLRLLRTPAGGGAARNWNRVTSEARGELVKLVCGDDVLAPECVARQVSALQEHPSAVLAASLRDVVDAHGRPLVRGRGLGPLDGLVPGAEAVRASVRSGSNLFGEPACVLLRREVVERVGGWSSTERYMIDLDLYVRALRHGDAVAVREVLAQFRVTGAQWSVGLARSQAAEARAFFRRVAREQPDAVSAADARLGAARAFGAAAARRAAYLVWSRRMSAPARPQGGAAPGR